MRKWSAEGATLERVKRLVTTDAARGRAEDIGKKISHGASGR